MKINESATSGATSAGAVASVAQPLNYSLQRRLPPTTLFGTQATSAKNIIKKPKSSK